MTHIFAWQLAGTAAAGSFLIAIIWSIVFPKKRLWPPKRSTTFVQIIIWGQTTIVIISAFWLGLGDWNSFGWPAALRWGLGLPMVIAGNLIVGVSAFYIGYAATSGAKTSLKTGGFYRYSRNPQYTADLILFSGWAILSASAHALPVIAITLITLTLTPFAEEPWLRTVYGEAYQNYCRKVRRFL